MNKYILYNYDDIMDLVYKNINLIPNDIDYILPVMRSGLQIAMIISKLKNINIINIENLYIGYRYDSRYNKIKIDFDKKIKILIVDDTVCYGRTMNKILKILSEFKNIEYKYYCVLNKSYHANDLIFLKNDMNDRIFPWNFNFRDDFCRQCCFDIDGVLCRNPTTEENDDGEKYISFIKNVQPLIKIPNHNVGYIVSGRLSKYLDLTKEWLFKNNIYYKDIFLMNCNTPEERKKKDAAIFKSDIFNKLNSCCFIESSSREAMIINNNTHKNVYCIESHKFYKS